MDACFAYGNLKLLGKIDYFKRKKNKIKITIFFDWLWKNLIRMVYQLAFNLYTKAEYIVGSHTSTSSKNIIYN